MSEITMCNNHNCPVAYKCYRHEAKPSELWQSYATFKYDEKKGCKDFYRLLDASNENQR